MFRGDGITWMKRSRLFVLFFLGGFQALGQAPDPTQWADFGLYAKEAPRAPETDRIQRTQLPLALGDTMRVALVGNTLFERMGHYGFFESWIHSKYPEAQLVFRNLAWSADTVSLRPRPDNFADLEQHLFRVQADLILMAFGFNESFSGKQGLEAFERALHDWVSQLQRLAFNGHSGPRMVLVSPIACEDVEGVAADQLNHEHLVAYSAAMQRVAQKLGVGFADMLTPSRAWLAQSSWQGTINGVHLNQRGYQRFSEDLYLALFGEKPPETNPELRHAVIEKNKQFFRRYRPLNTYYYTGARNKSFGYLDFLPAMQNFDVMVDNRDAWIWTLARGETASEPDDANVPVMPVTSQQRSINHWLSPQDELDAFQIDPRFEVQLFASEEMFPELACPIQMRWDSRGRLWVSCSTTYPHVYPGQEANDKLLILEDTDQDGRADQCEVFADDLHIPLSFELAHGGVYVSEEPYLSWIGDTDDDGKADQRVRLLAGFGCEDSHHALHDMVWTPDGDLMFRESIFHHSQVETPYGPVRVDNSSWFLFRPSEHRLTAFGSYPNTNPWGVTFDDWGFHVASHPVFASAFHALNPPYPHQHARAAGIPAYSGVCGHEFVDFEGWPEDMQGGFVKVRYKPTNRVEIHQWVEKGDHYEEVYQGNLLHSSNLSFIPTDLRYGPRGAMYVCDWYNPVKGHAQYSLRDDRRDRKSGRIWRILPKGMTLQDPPAIAGQSVDALLEILKRREYRYRYWAKRELRAHPSETVYRSLERWVEGLDEQNPRWSHHLAEAVWVARSVDRRHEDWLRTLFQDPDHHARAVAARMLRHWHDTMPDALGWLKAAVSDDHDLVRLEAAITASWMGGQEALELLLSMADRPMETHLRYAFVSALNAQTIQPLWQGKDAYAMVQPLLDSAKSAQAFLEPGMSARDAAFDRQQDRLTVRMACIPEQMRFTVETIEAKPNQPVKLIFTNPDATDHNWVLGQPGSLEAIGMAANAMAKDPALADSDFIPSEQQGLILAHSRMIGPGRETRIQVLRFQAPEQPGLYPYLCTFPGHWLIMKGVMVVGDDEAQRRVLLDGLSDQP